MQQHSRFLYRYRSLSGHNEKYVEATVAKGEIYFSSALAFNDPFEGRYQIDGRQSEAFRRMLLTRPFLQRRLQQEGFIAGESIADDELNQLLKWTQGQLQEFDESDREYLLNECSMLSLSELPDHPMMWAHYADGH